MIDGLSLRCNVGALLQEGNKLGAGNELGSVEVEGARDCIWRDERGKRLTCVYKYWRTGDLTGDL